MVHSVEERNISVLPQVASFFGAAAMDLGDWKLRLSSASGAISRVLVLPVLRRALSQRSFRWVCWSLPLWIGIQILVGMFWDFKLL